MPRVQFIVIELARNREGYNNGGARRTVTPVATAEEAGRDAARLGAALDKAMAERTGQLDRQSPSEASQ